MDIIEKIRLKIFELADPNSSYTQEDFDKEFSNISTTSVNYDVYKIGVKYANKSTNPDPAYATSGSSGFDLRANLTSQITIPTGKRAVVPTGLFFEIPENFEIQIRPRSGLAAKFGVTVLNSPGTIDSDYRGELLIILANLGEYEFVINHGDRIAQAVLATVTAKNIINLTKIDDISIDTERGAGKFGSTGHN